MAWSCDIDGNDITQYCQSIRWHPRWSRPSSAIIRVPSNTVSYQIGQSELHLYNGSLLFSGPVWFTEATGDVDAQYTEITAYDHLIYLSKRQCKTPISFAAVPTPNPPWPNHVPGPCNLADPSSVLTTYLTAPAIMAAFINAANDCDALNGALPYQITVGSVAGGGYQMTGATPTDWPMDIETMANMLLDTGKLGMIVNPGFGSSSVDFTNGDVRTDRTGSVSIQYATGAFNARSGNRTQDMDNVVNALWYLLGPKVYFYPQDMEHWSGSITPTARNAGGDGPGGDPAVPWDPGLVSRWTSSRSNYGYVQEIQVHDMGGGNATDNRIIRAFFEAEFEDEAYIRAVPRTFVNNSPNRATGLAPSFYVGDTITMDAGAALEGGFTGGFRVYEYEMQVDVDGIGEYTSIVGSANQE